MFDQEATQSHFDKNADLDKKEHAKEEKKTCWNKKKKLEGKTKGQET